LELKNLEFVVTTVTTVVDEFLKRFSGTAQRDRFSHRRSGRPSGRPSDGLKPVAYIDVKNAVAERQTLA